MSSQVEKLKVQVWIYWKNPENQQHYFLVLRTNPERGAFWQPVTGSVESDESLEDAAEREACEETGLPFQSGPQSLEKSFAFVRRGQKVREYGYSMEVFWAETAFPRVQLDPHEHTEYRWVSAEEALKMVAYPSNREMLQSLLGRLSY